MSESAYLTYDQSNEDVILNRAKDYYENDKERLRTQARDKYSNLCEEEKSKKKQIIGKIDIVICLKRKKRLKEYQKNYRQTKKVSIMNKIKF